MIVCLTKPAEEPHHRGWILANLLQSVDLFLFMNKLMFMDPALESLKVGMGHLKLSLMRLINAKKHV